MFKKELVSLVSFYGISPIHAGSGTSTGAVDNPIQRERHTNWPIIQATAVKGAMRSHFRRFFNLDKTNDKGNLDKRNDFLNYIFGSDEQDGWEDKSKNIPGAISVSDAKILAFPVRSNIAPFVWVTSPAVLKRFRRDIEFLGFGDKLNIPDISDVKGDSAVCINGCGIKGKVILEDAVVEVNGETVEIGFFKEHFTEVDKLILISDEMFKYVVENCTEIQTQIKIDEEKGTTKDGSLRYEELLPSDTLLYSVVYISESADKKLDAEAVLNNVKFAISGFLQIGGDETLGRGICRVRWINGKNS